MADRVVEQWCLDWWLFFAILSSRMTLVSFLITPEETLKGSARILIQQDPNRVFSRSWGKSLKFLLPRFHPDRSGFFTALFWNSSRSSPDRMVADPVRIHLGISQDHSKREKTDLFKNVERFLAGSFRDLNAMILLRFASFLFRIRQGMKRISLNACSMPPPKILTRATVKQSRILFFWRSPSWIGKYLEFGCSFRVRHMILPLTERENFRDISSQGTICMLFLGSFHSSRSLSIRISRQQRWVNINGRQNTFQCISLGDVYFRRQRCFSATRMIRTCNRINPYLEEEGDGGVEDKDRTRSEILALPV